MQQLPLNKVHLGLALEIVRKMPSDSIDLVFTSPPYWQLRDYGFSDQWGLEPTYTQYLDNMIALMRELKRVIKPTGSIYVNLGDNLPQPQKMDVCVAYPNDKRQGTRLHSRKNGRARNAV